MVSVEFRLGLVVATLLVATSGRVSPAPQVSQQAQDIKLSSKSLEKTADLTLLINETLRLNNKLVSENASINQNFRDDWTFERVEYDLMDFLQELNARYRHTNGSSIADSDGLAPSTDTLVGKRISTQRNASRGAYATRADPKTAEVPAGDVSSQIGPQQVASPVAHDGEASAVANKTTTTTTTTTGQNKDVEEQAAMASTKVDATTGAGPALLPISLATGDHDISESTWQYGIFDRFTRPRSSTTTPQPADLVSSGSSLDVRSFNSDECGLRSYREDPDYFPQSTKLDTDELSKELSQRRQRPTLVGSFFQSHKKHHLIPSGDQGFDRDELDSGEKLLPPPFDRYGGPATNNDHYQKSNYSSIDAGAFSGSSDPNNADSEFNLSSRRQWLQQQLGSTLQMLGINSTSPAALDYFINQTTSVALNSRENMMKMSGANKLGKSMSGPNREPASIDPGQLSGPEITEQELNARQDELKLEARVIGGNDARLGDSPWSASLQALVTRPGTGSLEYRHYCGGTIISEYYILTAAHCLDFMVGRESRLFIVIGDLNWRMSAASMHGRRFGIEKLIIHGGYKSTAFGHDLGLIRTKESMKPLKVNGRYIINSVCLPERNVEHSGEAELVGWGLFSNRNEMADMLQIADVPILPRPLCVDLYRRRTGLIQWLIGIELITEKQICAGTFGRGICQGDSGSALVYNDKVQLDGKALSTRFKSHLVRDAQQRATIIGIVAFGGIRRCSYQSLPGVYMQTSKYLDWILPRIQQ